MEPSSVPRHENGFELPTAPSPSASADPGPANRLTPGSFDVPLGREPCDTVPDASRCQAVFSFCSCDTSPAPRSFDEPLGGEPGVAVPDASRCFREPSFGHSLVASSAPGSFDLPLGRVPEESDPDAVGCRQSSFTDTTHFRTTPEPTYDAEAWSTPEAPPASSLGPLSQGLGVAKLVLEGRLTLTSRSASLPPFLSLPVHLWREPGSLPGSAASTFLPAELWHELFSCLG